MVGKAWRQELETGSRVTRAVRKYRKEREALKSYGLPLVTHLPKGHKGANIQTYGRNSPLQPQRSQMATRGSTSKGGPSLSGFYAPKFSMLGTGCVLFVTQTALPSKTKF